MSRKLKPVSPGEMLAEEFLKPLSISNYRLAKEIGVPAQRIGEILAGKRAITAGSNLRLCRSFGLSDAVAAFAGGLRHRDREGDAGEDLGEHQTLRRIDGRGQGGA